METVFFLFIVFCTFRNNHKVIKIMKLEYGKWWNYAILTSII